MSHSSIPKLPNLSGYRAPASSPFPLHQAGIEFAERQRSEALGAATGKDDRAIQRALRAAAALPQLIKQSEAQVMSELKVFSDSKRVHETREAIWELMENGRIVLKPTSDRKALLRAVRLRGLGPHCCARGMQVKW
jgi:hypothetical protein